MTRAFVASAGAGMSLVAAAVVALFLVSAVVAVQGWPGIDPDDDVPALVLSEMPPAPARTATEATAAGAPPSAARAPRARRTAAPIVLGAAGASGGSRRGGVPGSASRPAPVPSEPAPPAPETPSGGGTTSAPGEPAGPAGSAGGAIDEVAPGAGSTVTDAVGTVTEGPLDAAPGGGDLTAVLGG